MELALAGCDAIELGTDAVDDGQLQRLGKPFDAVHMLARTQAHADSHAARNALMQEKAGTVPSGQEYIRVAQQLERIGDLSTNISEEVVFMVEGHSIKHHAERAEVEAARD